jgi:hypothetical protein
MMAVLEHHGDPLISALTDMAAQEPTPPHPRRRSSDEADGERFTDAATASLFDQ